MQKPRFEYEPTHFEGKFFHDLWRLPVELVRAFHSIVRFGLAIAYYRLSRLWRD